MDYLDQQMQNLGGNYSSASGDGTSYFDQQMGSLQAPQTATQQPQQTNEQPAGEQFARQLGLTGRYLEGAFPKVIAGSADLVNSGVNAASGALNKYVGTQIPPLRTDLNSVVDKGFTKLGFPEPQGGLEKGVGAAAQTVAGLMTGGEQGYNTLKEMASNAKDMIAPAQSVGPSTAAQAKKIASQFYQQAQDSGGVLKPNFTNDFIDKVSSLAPQTEAGKIFAGETPVTQLVGRLQALKDQPLSLPAIQEIDEHLGNMIDSEYGIGGLSKNGRNLLDIQSTLRNMVKDASSDDIVGGKDGFDALNNGRKAWAQAAKMGDLEKIQTRAQFSDNPATTIKSGIRTLLSNPTRTRGYSLEELDALQKAGQRGLLGNTFHVFGSRLIPLGTGLVGESIGGPVGAAVGAGAGHAGSTMMRNAATSIQTKRLNDALQLLGQGVPQ